MTFIKQTKLFFPDESIDLTSENQEKLKDDETRTEGFFNPTHIIRHVQLLFSERDTILNRGSEEN